MAAEYRVPAAWLPISYAIRDLSGEIAHAPPMSFADRVSEAVGFFAIRNYCRSTIQ
jgi:hypothetical protein